MVFTNGPKFLMLLGAALFVLGFLWQLLGPNFSFGKLPGDIAVEKENFRFYFPVMTSIILSVLLSLIFWLMRRFF